MATPVARVHLAVAHAALPPLLPTPPKCKRLPLLPTPPPCPCVTAAIAILPNLPPPAKPCSRSDADERWDARKTTKPPLACPPPASSSASSSSSSGPRSSRKNATTSPLSKPGRADAVERWDAHKKQAAAAISSASSSSSSSSSATSSLLASSSKLPISRASSSAGRCWDVHKKRRRQLQADQRLDDGESNSSTGSNSIDGMDTEEEIVWKPRAMYAGPGFVAAAPEPSMFPMPTAFLLPVA